MADNTIEWSESSFVNSRGSKIYTQQWLVANPKAIIVYLHGYGDHSHWLIKDGAEKMAKNGIAAFAFDQEGHGKSDGLAAYVQSFDNLAEDSITYIEYAKSLFPGLKCFLHGGSMGGAIVLLTALKRPELASGLILMAPMIKVNDSAKPHPLVVEALKGLAYFFPTLPIVPNVDIIDLAFRKEEDRVFARNYPLGYKGRVRLGTGLAILQITDYLQANLDKITQPLLVVHGTGDLVTSHELSEELFEKAQSKDKTIYLYEGLWHVLSMEPNGERVEQDINAWIVSRVESDHAGAVKKFIQFDGSSSSSSSLSPSSDVPSSSSSLPSTTPTVEPLQSEVVA